jgi:hypothetical protein
VSLRSSLFSCAALSTLALSALACVGAPESADDVSDDSSIGEVAPAPGAFRPMALHLLVSDSSLATTSPSGAHLNYYGGPVLSSVDVIPVYWNSSVAYQTELNAFYAAFPTSELFEMLSQYSGIGTGSRGAPFVSSQTSTTLTDAQIQSALSSMIQAGQISTPTSNTYYPLHFPSGVSITASDGTKSCVTWCAYHSTFKYNGVDVNYGVIPDQGGGCAGGCGANSQRFNNLTSVSSHEMVEAITDPGVGLATSYSSPLAWYDPNNGEIGDICNAQQADIIMKDGSVYTVQREFSNSDSNCTWGVLADHNLSMNGTCYPAGTMLMQHELTTLIFQSDGNLVLYKTTGGSRKAVWASGTNGKGATDVCLQGDGNLVVYSPSKALWASGTNGSGANDLKLQTDCNLVLYNAQGQAKWATGTNPCL